MNKSSVRPRKRNGAALVLAKWHRRIGIAAALIVVWLALTGILLGHTDDLGLDQRHVSAARLLDWYGIPAPAVIGYRAGDDWVMQAGERVYFNDRPLPGEFGPLAGAAVLGSERIAAAGGRLLVLTRTGDVVEVLGKAHGVPGTVRNIGAQNGRLVVRTEQGDYAASGDLLTWRRLPAAHRRWAQALEVPDLLRNRVAQDYRGRLVTLERLVLDMHSGRLFGRFGVLVFDLAAVAFVLLAASGLWLWLARRPLESKGR